MFYIILKSNNGKKSIKVWWNSVGTIERILHVAEIVKKEFVAGHDVIVIVSAMAGETNEFNK